MMSMNWCTNLKINRSLSVTISHSFDILDDHDKVFSMNKIWKTNEFIAKLKFDGYQYQGKVGEIRLVSIEIFHDSSDFTVIQQSTFYSF